ncbi:MAG: cation:proton antiporter [Bdellovibrionales bacterium]|nr:cation:proton antiporter [Bdellovibrionales bacterium]
MSRDQLRGYRRHRISGSFYLLLASAVALLGSAGGSSPVTKVLLGLVIILIAAKIGGDLAVRLGQPEVLGELVVGVLLGNLTLIGLNFFEFLQANEALEILSELGVILLLFQVGLETSVAEMRKVGLSSLLAAVLGVIAPFFGGYFVSAWFAPEAHLLVHVFVGATLTATSVGITARVLQELGKVRTQEGKIILGAAVIDDVLGLLVLAIVTGIIGATNRGTELELLGIAQIVLYAVGFLVVAVMLGAYVSPLLFSLATRLRSHGVLLAVSLAICFSLAYAAAMVGLAPIVGAFTAGLILEPVHYRELLHRNENEEIDHLVAPIASLLVPIFFVSMGAKVDVTVFGRGEILHYAFWLTLVAAVAKQVCGLGVMAKGVDRLAVGLGMIPRGEVGLIFAGIGASLTLLGEPVVDAATFGAVIIMVIVTTMITPPLIKWRFSQPVHANVDEKEKQARRA